MIQVTSSMYDYMYIYFLPPTQEATDSVSGSITPVNHTRAATKGR